MMRVNEAYMAILAERMRGVPTGAADGASAPDAEGPRRDTTSLRPDPARRAARAAATARAVARPGYTYYKLGFDFYRKGIPIYSKDPRIIRSSPSSRPMTTTC